MKKDTAPDLSEHALRGPHIMTDGWYVLKEELFIHEKKASLLTR